MKALWTIITLLIMAVGLVGTVLPVIPGILLIYAGYLVYGFATGWQAYGLAAIVGWSVVTGLVLLLDFYAGAIGAKRYGASRSGTWGSFIGGLIGALAAGFPGLILGPFFGAAAGELLRGWDCFSGTLSGRPDCGTIRSGFRLQCTKMYKYS